MKKAVMKNIEPAYSFRKDLDEVHKRDRRNPVLKPCENETSPWVRTAALARSIYVLCTMYISERSYSPLPIRSNSASMNPKPE